MQENSLLMLRGSPFSQVEKERKIVKYRNQGIKEP